MNDQQSKSAIYTGWVRHRRFLPVEHQFRYPVMMCYLDLDELKGLFQSKWFCSLNRLNILSFHRKDYFQPEKVSLKQAVINYVCQALPDLDGGDRKPVSVRMLTQPRYLNLTFNPVTFYYCFDKEESLVAIVAEITNTPWGERHAYVLPIGQSSDEVAYQLKGNKKHNFAFDKVFHVSPFNPMNMQYRWNFSEPSQGLQVHMDNLMLAHEDIEKHFDATLALERKHFSKEIGKVLIHYPLMTVKVVWGIYWQALKLWLKKAPVYDHPQGNRS